MTETSSGELDGIERLIRDAEWRGQMEARVSGQDTRLRDLRETIVEGFATSNANFNRRTDRQDDRLESIEEHAKKTNSRVNTLEANAVADMRVGAEQEKEKTRIADSIRFRTNAKLVILAAAIGGGLGEAVTLISHIFS